MEAYHLLLNNKNTLTIKNVNLMKSLEKFQEIRKEIPVIIEK